MTNVTPIITPTARQQENQIIKAYFDRLVRLFTDAENLKADIKDIVDSAKDSGVDAAAMKKLAALTARDKVRKARKDIERMESMARLCGQLDFFAEVYELN